MDTDNSAGRASGRGEGEKTGDICHIVNNNNNNKAKHSKTFNCLTEDVDAVPSHLGLPLVWVWSNLSLKLNSLATDSNSPGFEPQPCKVTVRLWASNSAQKASISASEKRVDSSFFFVGVLTVLPSKFLLRKSPGTTQHNAGDTLASTWMETLSIMECVVLAWETAFSCVHWSDVT